MTPDALIAAVGCKPDVAAAFARPISDAMAQYHISSSARQAAFLAQMAHESALFSRMVENMIYTSAERIVEMFGPSLLPMSSFAKAPKELDGAYRHRLYARRLEIARGFVRKPEQLANKVYAYKNGNGSESSGDGWAFRGRGLPGLTGRDNYAAFGMEIGDPMIAHPDLVSQPGYACLAGGWFWKLINGNHLADAGRFDTITRRINGPAMAGARDRRRLHLRAIEALSRMFEWTQPN